MAKTALIIGGTKGLGLALAWEASFNRNIETVVAGRSAFQPPPYVRNFRLDLTDPESVTKPALLLASHKLRPMDYVLWVAGNFSRQPLEQMPLELIQRMIATHLSGPVRTLQLIHQKLIEFNHPYHLITIASTSSWRMRNDETLYCALKAAKAAFTRNFARELVRDLPGSKVTLVNPGGMKTGLFNGTDQNISKFMDPDEVARIIWNEVEHQNQHFKEVQIMRNEDGSPNVSYGPRLPELPFGEIVIPEDLRDRGILSEEQSNRIREALGFEGDL